MAASAVEQLHISCGLDESSSLMVKARGEGTAELELSLSFEAMESSRMTSLTSIALSSNGIDAEQAKAEPCDANAVSSRDPLQFCQSLCFQPQRVVGIPCVACCYPGFLFRALPSRDSMSTSASHDQIFPPRVLRPFQGGTRRP